jgi:hypothetical protein
MNETACRFGLHGEPRSSAAAAKDKKIRKTTKYAQE